MICSKSHRLGDCKPGPFQVSKTPSFDTSVGCAFRRTWEACEKTQIAGLTLGDSDSVGMGQGPGIFILTVVQVIATHRQVCKLLIDDSLSHQLSWLSNGELLCVHSLAEIMMLVGEQSISSPTNPTQNDGP